MAAARALLPDGRWHFQHGPMDIVLGGDGDARALAAAHEDAWSRFEPLLGELVAELRLLRTPIDPRARFDECPLAGAVARRMWQACWPHRAGYITPMAAVAGAVAQALLPAYERDGVRRAWINNGGDIALHLTPGSSVRVGVFGDLSRLGEHVPGAALAHDGHCEIAAASPVRGVATSGWRGRSFSLGIADSVTVLARTAADADAAATVIANAVNVADARIVRAEAASLQDDSDLGDLLVTVDVPPLDVDTVEAALSAGLARAESLRAAGRVQGALLLCQGRARVCGNASVVGLASAARTAVAHRPAAEVGSVFA